MPEATIRTAKTKEDFEQIHVLNHKTFVEEIPQHSKQDDSRLIDHFHHKNRYIIALIEQKLVGMICYHTEKPFSLEKKGVDLDHFIQQSSKIAEVRLLAIEPQWRHKRILPLLLKALIKELKEQQIDFGLISATTRQIKLYEKIGFTPFGNLVGKNNALYQPMYITFNRLSKLLQP